MSVKTGTKKGREQIQRELADLREEVNKLKRMVRKLKQSEKRLKESEKTFRSLIESADDSIYLVDNNYRYLFINKKHLSRLGLSDEDYSEHSYRDFHTPVEVREFVKKVDSVFRTGEPVQFEYKSIRDNKYFLQTFSPVKDSEGRTVAVGIISKDISDRKEMEEELRQLSLTDELTGLLNRRGFFTHVEQYLKMVKRQKTGVFMLYADLDNLKYINDRFGHKEGDFVLIQVARILKENYRESDIIARIGGDEFVVIPVGSSGECIGVITSRLQEAIHRYNEEAQKGYILSVSTGVVFYDAEEPCSIDELLAMADKKMYEDKARKKRLTS
jgi:diguanylate cyclase (GGDEF)-like protein/PAS domain S-box-containing protein